MDKGLGSVTWWGFSPAVDVLSLYNKHVDIKNSDCSDMNILLVGSGDPRHIIKTIATRYRHETKKRFNFYVIENNLEVYARSLLLLGLTLESKSVMGLQEKAELFAEIFGNSLIRLRSAKYIQFMSSEFVKMVTDFDLLSARLPIFDLSLLKYKERDMLENIFKLWRKEGDAFDIEQAWDLRVRSHLGTRYDSSKGVFDWDFSMKLCERGAEIIGSKNYLRWRKNGIAFELREGTYDVPNKTLASAMVFKIEGDRIGRRGYWGDIVVSPYISFGIECDNEIYFKRANREFINDSEKISEYNLLSYFHELQTGERYDTSKSQDDGLATVIEEPQSVADKNADENRFKFLIPEDVKITFLPLSSLPDIFTKQKYQKFFDVVYFSNSMVHHLVEPISAIFSDNTLLILETAKFITELSKDQYKQFAEKVNMMASSVGCKPLQDLKPESDNFLLYKFSRIC